MDQRTVILVLLVLGLLCVPVGARWRLPAPVVATLFGAALGLVPGASLDPPPELILPVLLPPLLYAAVQQTSWRRFARGWRPILLLAVALVFVTTAAVAAVAARIDPVLPLGAAVVLGAITAPPDPAAVSAVAGRLGLPRRTITLLEGEGLFNDVTALTIYQVAVAGVATGTLSVWGAAAEFGYTALAGAVVGLLTGLLFGWLFDRLPTAELRAGLSLLIPYTAYLTADSVHASGVLAVLAAGFWLGGTRADPDDVAGRLSGRNFWDVIEQLVTGFTFGLIGLEFIQALDDLQSGLWAYTRFALLICLTLVVVRFAWMFGVRGLTRRLSARDPADVPVGWGETLIVAWAGMRGVVTIATALALPRDFPGRTQIVFVAAVVAVATLLVPGVTLPWLVRRTGLTGGALRRQEAARRIVAAAQEAGLHRLEELRADGTVGPETARRLGEWQRAILLDEDAEDAEWVSQRKRLGEVRAQLLAASRAAVLELREREPEAADDVLRRLDLHSAVY
ncbi:cation:proton antiporter [Catellatospora bangladeshensis]|uniref:Na+/H+ antiporter n=1 Tax=Catellatospora bangladeshensis TaxID=310355 RepID=A0A8J3NLJ0_9ACTN|nr:sodium:proton antiporter [Catellatospora bangladeshensis]GIF83981.1 Na+/H+ antiporter [Catellatospora bangladeshensis]